MELKQVTSYIKKHSMTSESLEDDSMFNMDIEDYFNKKKMSVAEHDGRRMALFT